MIETFPADSPVHAGHRVKFLPADPFGPHAEFWCVECSVCFRADGPPPKNAEPIRWCVKVGDEWRPSQDARTPED